MGAFTVALGLPRLALLQPQFQPHFARAPRLSARQVLYSQSVGKDRPYSRRIGRPCSASVSWPHESWATREAQAEGRSGRGVWEQEGGVEALAMGVGVVVSVAAAFAKHGAGAVAGASVGMLSLAILTATTVALRQQLAGLLRILVAQFNAVQAALAVQLSSIRQNVIIWGTRTEAPAASNLTTPFESVSFAGTEEDRPDEVNSSAEAKALSSAEIEAALSHIAKSVAQLTMVVASLDTKISTLEKDASSRHLSEVSRNNKIAEGDVTLVPAFTDVEQRQRGIYRIRNSNESKTQLKWEEAFFEDRRTNGVQPQGCEPSEDSRASNRADVISASDYDSKALSSTILYDSRGDRVLLLDSRPVNVTFEIGRNRETLSQSARSKASGAQTEDSPMEFFFQDVGARALREEVAPETQDHGQAKQDNAAVDLFFQDAGRRAPEVDELQLKQKLVETPTAVENVAQASPVPRGPQDTDRFKYTAAPRSGEAYNEADASRVSWEAAGSATEYEVDASEGYRVVPVFRESGSKPDALRLKRIMSGTQPSAAFTDEAAQQNAWTQNETNGTEMSRAKGFYYENPGSQVGGTGSSAGGEEYEGNNNRSETYGVKDSVGVGRGAARPHGVQDVLSYGGQEGTPRGRPRPEGGEGTKASSRADYGQRWGRQGSSDASDADFGGNGSSSDTNEGENGRKRRPGSSGTANDSGSEVEPPASRGSPPSPSAERTGSFRNLPEPKAEEEGLQKLLDEVEALLKEGREGLEGRIEVGVAERMLYDAARLCEKAVEVRPSSLLAVGLWGNTLLLHGELKLRLSQNLRSMLPEPPSKSLSRQALKEAEEEKLSLESTLQAVGEECEQLLVEAGRKYRLALSMDRNDMRALYNWGLALCYRGQLIAEEGGETAAQDADKVFLAAIDKFEAMIGLSDLYAAGALLNWGLAMRDRSRLRPLGSPERQRILSQAKEVFQEALRLDPNYGQARGAVAACVAELKELQEYDEEAETNKTKDAAATSRGFRDWWG